MARQWASATLALAIILLVAGIAFLGIANSQAANGEHDTDNDGLIEVSNLEQLNAMRYDLNGDGRPDRDSSAEAYAAAFPDAAAGTVCPGNNCFGYELTRPLDFCDRASYASNTVNEKWTEGSGWLPIGVGGERFDATFEGNGHTISNLHINRPTELDAPRNTGLFGSAGGLSVVRRTRLVDVSVTANSAVGGLVGENYGAITGSHVTGSVSGKGLVGGLVGRNGGTITGSYAIGSFSGGLVGENNGPITGSFVTGSLSGVWSSIGLVGGLNQYQGGMCISGVLKTT